MQLGFVSAILGDLTLEEVMAFAADEGFACVEVMCWPVGRSDRRYAGVTHLDVSNFTDDAAEHVLDLIRIHGVAISGLGYYPNPLDSDPKHRETVSAHLIKIIRAAPKIGVRVVNTFIGRAPAETFEENMSRVHAIWQPIVAEAEMAGVTIGIENCPMLFSNDEWPGGKNIASSPRAWRALREMFPSGVWGLNFDPSHCVPLMLDTCRAIREFGKQFVHVHAKDERIDADRLYEVGVTGMGWHEPKLPGLGDVKWGPFFAALTDVGYRGPVCIEVEDRAYEGSLNDRKRALRQSRKFLEQFFG